MIRLLLQLFIFSILASCSNTPELETGEIKTMAMLTQALQHSNQPKRFVNSRLIINREKIDEANIPVLFVELPSGQNGTLTPYPGQGIGQTWLGADGATLSLQKGVLVASRGMGDDLMGSTLSMPSWSKIKNKSQIYSRELSHINGNNKISKRVFRCEIQKINSAKVIEIWSVRFPITKFEETCAEGDFKIRNIFYLDNQKIVRKSKQYHSDTVGYILTERLDR